MGKKEYSRRKFINKCLHTGSLFFGGALLLNSCNTKNEPCGKEESKKQSTSDDPCNDLSGVSDEEMRKRQSLGYAKKSPVPENYCGGCLLFKGPVYKEGHCAQWVAKTE